MRGRPCNGICEKFAVPKPHGMRRYESGQCRCQICDVWMDYRGCHLRDDSPATRDSEEGWFCNCCNYMIRRKSRNILYKTKMQAKNPSTEPDGESSQIDLSYFNKRRAIMIQKIVRCIKGNTEDFVMSDFQNRIENSGITVQEIENEFDVPVEHMIKLSCMLDPPNKISMIREFEMIRKLVGRTPTKEDLRENSLLDPAQYDDEFTSWEHMLERLGDDPWYRDSKDHVQSELQSLSKADTSHQDQIQPDEGFSMVEIRRQFRDGISHMPSMVELFDVLDANIGRYDKSKLEEIIDRLD